MLQQDWSEGCVFINPDEIAKNEFGDWNSPKAVFKAVVRAQEMQRDEHRQSPTVSGLVKEFIEKYTQKQDRNWQDIQRMLNKEVVSEWGQPQTGKTGWNLQHI